MASVCFGITGSIVSRSAFSPADMGSIILGEIGCIADFYLDIVSRSVIVG